MQDFRGNRAYVIFPNGAFIWYQQGVISRFLNQQPSNNRLLQAVLADVTANIPLQGCRALGFFDFAVIRPLWILLRNSSVSMRSMSSHYEVLVDWYKSLSNGMPVSRDALPFPELTTQVLDSSAELSLVWESIFEETATDHLFKAAVQVRS